MKKEWILNLLMRSVLGIIAIYFINTILVGLGYSCGIGINAVTVLTSGILGFSGISLLYAILALRLL